MGTRTDTQVPARRRRLSSVLCGIALMGVAAAAVLACSAETGEGEARGEGTVTVQEAVRENLRGRVAVRGSVLIARDGTARLCASLAESFPPQCHGPFLVLRGLDPRRLPRRSTGGGVTWTERVTLRGTLRDGVLTIRRR